MKKPTVDQLSGIVKVGAGAVLGSAAIAFFIVKTHAPLSEAAILEGIQNSSPGIVRIETSSTAESSGQGFESRAGSVSESAENAPVNINTATAEELQSLSGIGEAKAAAIIEYREQHGEFSDISEIMNVSGIGKKIFDDIRDKITVGNAQNVSNSAQNPEQNSVTNPASEVSFPININTASAEELQALSGIGEAKAAAIIAYREQHGEFSDVSEIMSVSGIGEKIFEDIRDKITVGNVQNVSSPAQNPEQNSVTNPASEVSFPININTASAEELQALSGIGEVKAAAIIAYREQHGTFSDVSEIMNVSGIGEKIFESIRDNITVGNVPNVSNPTQNSEQNSLANPASEASLRININTASAEELRALSGIGEVKAAAIVAYREEHGAFSDISEIKNVKGIGEKIFENIRADITV